MVDNSNGNEIRVKVAENVTSWSNSVASTEVYGSYSVEAVSVSNSSAYGISVIVVEPAYISVSPSASDVAVGETVVLSSFYDDGNPCVCNWYIDGEEVANSEYSFRFTPSVEGTSIITAKWSSYPLVTTTASVTAIDNGGGETPEPSPEPSPDPSPDPSGDWVTIPDMNTSQSNQTSEIKSYIDVKSNLLLSAIESLENSLANSNIYDLFTQSFVYYDFDFQTGNLSTGGNTYNGFVPTFNHWAQNVEKYLGMLVDVRASEDEEEVKENSQGFWTIVSNLFKKGENGEQAAADTDNMNSILRFGDRIKELFNTGGDIDDIFIIINSDETWSFFTDEVADNIDSTGSTYSIRNNVLRGYTDRVYSEYYNNVLGREWGE